MAESSDEWLSRQKQKLQALREREHQLNINGNMSDGGDHYMTSKSHSRNTSGNYADSRDKRQLVEELKTKQHTWKQEKTEKTTEFVEDDSNLDRNSRKTTYRFRSPERPIAAPQPAPPVVYQPLSEPPHQVGGGGSTFKEARYFSETKKVEEEVIPSPTLPCRYYQAAAPAPALQRLQHDSRYSDDYSRSQGYNTLTSEEEFEHHKHHAMKSSSKDDYRGSSATRYHDRNMGMAICPRRPDLTEECHYPARVEDWDGGRLRSKSFGGDQIWSDHSYLRRAGGREWREGDFKPSSAAAEVFREAIRNVGPDGEIIYTSRRYDTSKKSHEESSTSSHHQHQQQQHQQLQQALAPPPVIQDREIHYHHHYPVPIPAPVPAPVIYYPPQIQPQPPVYSYDGDDIIVTETYKRTKETRYEDDASQVVTSTTSIPPPPSGAGRELAYHRTFTEERGGTPPPSLLAPITAYHHQIPVQTGSNNMRRSYSAHNMLDENCENTRYGYDRCCREGGDGGKTYYYRKTTTYDDESSRPCTPVARPGSGTLMSSSTRMIPVQQSSSYQKYRTDVTGPTQHTVYQSTPQHAPPASTLLHTSNYLPSGYHAEKEYSSSQNYNYQQQQEQLQNQKYNQQHSSNHWSSSGGDPNRPQHVMMENKELTKSYPQTNNNTKFSASKYKEKDENYYASNSASSSYEASPSYYYQPNQSKSFTDKKGKLQHHFHSASQRHNKNSTPSKHEIRELEMFLKDFN